MKLHALSFKEPQSYFSLPLWKWPSPGDYNGFSGAERIRGWQFRVFLARNGWLKPPARCSVTGATAALTYHSENYLRPWEPIPLTRGVHVRVHQRFKRPAAWRDFLKTEAQQQTWARRLTCHTVTVEGRGPDFFIEAVLAASPFPEWVIVPWGELFRDDVRVASLEPMSDKEIASFVASNQWTFAKTMPHTPHEYVTKRRCSDPHAFERMVMEIRRAGEVRRFGPARYTYLDFDGNTYWTMGCTLSSTWIINRARIVR